MGTEASIPFEFAIVFRKVRPTERPTYSRLQSYLYRVSAQIDGAVVPSGAQQNLRVAEARSCDFSELLSQYHA